MIGQRHVVATGGGRWGGRTVRVCAGVCDLAKWGKGGEFTLDLGDRELTSQVMKITWMCRPSEFVLGQMSKIGLIAGSFWI